MVEAGRWRHTLSKITISIKREPSSFYYYMNPQCHLFLMKIFLGLRQFFFLFFFSLSLQIMNAKISSVSFRTKKLIMICIWGKDAGVEERSWDTQTLRERQDGSLEILASHSPSPLQLPRDLGPLPAITKPTPHL